MDLAKEEAQSDLASTMIVMFPPDMVNQIIKHIPRPKYRARMRKGTFLTDALNEQSRSWVFEIILHDPPKPDCVLLCIQDHIPFNENITVITGDDVEQVVLQQLRKNKPQSYAGHPEMMVKDGLMHFTSDDRKIFRSLSRVSLPFSEELIDDMYQICAKKWSDMYSLPPMVRIIGHTTLLL
jgi:hypothetical protein